MRTNTNEEKWILQPDPCERKPYRLFCFPFAGGGASAYYRWPRMLPAEIGVYAVRPPGRENRIKEKPFTRLSVMIEELAFILLPFLNKPFAFFGHSMGALIGYELAQYIHRNFSIGPAHLFVAAGRAPHLVNLEPPYFNLPQDRFLEKLKRYNGMPAEILQNDDLMAFIMPSLRADMEMIQTYSGRDRQQTLACPISAFGGTTDSMVVRDHLKEWQAYTHNAFSLQMLESGHFFSPDAEQQLLQAIASDFKQTLEER